MADSDLVTIETTWNHDGNIDSSLHIFFASNEELSEHYEEDITELSPIYIRKPDQDSDTCSLSIKQCCTKEVKIIKIRIISDVRTVEVYHRLDGNMFCMRGKVLSSKEEGKMMFVCSSKLDLSSQDIYFKFPVKSNIETIKLYNVSLEILFGEENKEIGGQGSMIDLEKVKGYLGEIPENAQSLFKNMESYQKNQQSMKAAMMSGGNMGSFGMMGLMSALMGGISPRNGHMTAPVHKSCDLQKVENLKLPATSLATLTDNSDKNVLNSLHDDVALNLDKKKNESRNISGDVLSGLMSKMEAGQPDENMFEMLKGICSKVSENRTSASKDTDVNGTTDIEEKSTVSATNKQASDADIIRKAIEEQFMKTEDRLQKYIDEKMSAFEVRMNEKLDRILDLMSKSNDAYPP